MQDAQAIHKAIQSAQARQEYMQAQRQRLQAIQQTASIASQRFRDSLRLVTEMRGATHALITPLTEAHALINPHPPAWLAAMRTEATQIQALMNHLKEENERVQKMASSLLGMATSPIQDVLAHEAQAASSVQRFVQARAQENEHLQRMVSSLRDALLRSPATIIAEWAQARQRHQAASERRMCADALEAFAHEPEHAKRFVQALGFRPSPSFLCAVWEALREGRWINADKPLQYVRSVACRLYKQDEEQNESLFNSMFLSLDAGPTGALLPPPLHASCNPWVEEENRCDKERPLEQQGLAAGLSPDALIVYKLRELSGDHISRRTLPDMLQWTPQRVERAWRQMCRKMGPRKK